MRSFGIKSYHTKKFVMMSTGPSLDIKHEIKVNDQSSNIFDMGQTKIGF